jgi:hypothetical protein
VPAVWGCSKSVRAFTRSTAAAASSESADRVFALLGGVDYQEAISSGIVGFAIGSIVIEIQPFARMATLGAKIVLGREQSSFPSQGRPAHAAATEAALRYIAWWSSELRDALKVAPRSVMPGTGNFLACDMSRERFGRCDELVKPGR